MSDTSGQGRWRRELQIPHGYQVRRCLGGLSVVLGLGRLLSLGLTATLSFGLSELFGAFLLAGGLALWLTAPHRLTRAGRLAAGFGVFCFAFIGVGTYGSTAALLYGWCALCVFAETISRREDDC